MGLRGLEPPTSRLSGVRSNHLSYKPMLVFGDGRRFFVFRRPVVEMRRIELLTPCLQGRCSPSWATPPYFNLRLMQGPRNLSFSFPRLKVHNLSIAPSKLNNDLQVLILIDHRIWALIQNSGLLRKEVIQPHLPIRLPCYDFTLITTPTFGRALQEG